jgi:hypothetical protein
LTGQSGYWTAFFRTSAIGFAVLDSQLRYQAINNCLARINGIAAKEHLGAAVTEIFGEFSKKTAKARYHRVLVLGQTRSGTALAESDK